MRTEAGGKAPYQFNWLNEHLRTPNERRIYAQELAVLVATQTIVDAMEAAQLSRAELANRIGKSKGFVSQVLSGRNMTMRTFGDLLWACDRQVSEVLAVPMGQSTVPPDFMDNWLDCEPTVRQEDALVSNRKTLEVSIEPEAVCMGVAA
jgi:transcriptional regulator with XRE-family HTH domain